MLFQNWNKNSQIQCHVNSQSLNKNLSLKEKQNHHKAMLEEGVTGERQGKVSKLDVLG